MNRLILIFIFVLTGNVMAEERPWMQAELDFEGFPLYLRYPAGLKYEELKKSYPKFITVTHILSEVKNSGLPKSEYNESLFEFDGQLIDILENAGAGITVLVETYAGERAYYMYSKDDFLPELLEKKLKESFPEHEVEISSKNDSEWSFIKQYAKDWDFEA